MPPGNKNKKGKLSEQLKYCSNIVKEFFTKKHQVKFKFLGEPKMFIIPAFQLCLPPPSPTGVRHSVFGSVVVCVIPCERNNFWAI